MQQKNSLTVILNIHHSTQWSSISPAKFLFILLDDLWDFSEAEIATGWWFDEHKGGIHRLLQRIYIQRVQSSSNCGMKKLRRTKVRDVKEKDMKMFLHEAPHCN